MSLSLFPDEVSVINKRNRLEISGIVKGKIEVEPEKKGKKKRIVLVVIQIRLQGLSLSIDRLCFPWFGTNRPCDN